SPSKLPKPSSSNQAATTSVAPSSSSMLTSSPMSSPSKATGSVSSRPSSSISIATNERASSDTPATLPSLSRNRASRFFAGARFMTGSSQEKTPFTRQPIPLTTVFSGRRQLRRKLFQAVVAAGIEVFHQRLSLAAHALVSFRLRSRLQQKQHVAGVQQPQLDAR